jgi:predicted amidohydrolase
MDLAALLALAEEASDEGASVIVCPRLPGLASDSRIYQAFIANVREHAPGSLVIIPSVAGHREESLHPFVTPLGRTLALIGDDCIDPECHARAWELRVEAMVWQPEPESALQAEAALEVALDATLSVAGLVLVTGLAGDGDGARGFGGSAIVQLGDIVAEAGPGEECVYADVDVPVPMPERHSHRPELPPILAQRLAHHRGGKLQVDWPADLS